MNFAYLVVIKFYANLLIESLFAKTNVNNVKLMHIMQDILLE